MGKDGERPRRPKAERGGCFRFIGGLLRALPRHEQPKGAAALKNAIQSRRAAGALQKELEIMPKKLYSLMLSEEVVREVDREAHRRGTSRSGLVDRLLAEALSMQTCEARIQDILDAVFSLFSEDRGLVPQFTPNQPTMALKSMLEYRYRPTIRYEVTLFPPEEERAAGLLTVIFRTQSTELLEAMRAFFSCWASLEGRRRFVFSEGRVTRDLLFTENRFCSPRSAKATPDSGGKKDEESSLASAIAAYIRLLDRALKGFLTGRLTEEDLSGLYRDYLSRTPVIV